METGEDILQGLLTDIVEYMGFLRRDMDLYVSVHQMDIMKRAFLPFMLELRQVNYHECPYCLYVKTDSRLHAECIKHQQAVTERNIKEEFFGTCWLGVGEYCFPLLDGSGNVYGMISVSGYRGDAEKTRAQTKKICRRYGLNESEFTSMQSTLRADIPPADEIRRVIRPLQYMFMLLQSKLYSYGDGICGAEDGQSEVFDRVRRHIRMRFSTDQTLGELAGMFSVSESSLSKMFRKYAKCTYRQYVNRVRMNIAAYYLQYTSVSVRQLSDILGYSGPTYFNYVFRNTYDMTPEEYRRSHAEDIYSAPFEPYDGSITSLSREERK